MRSRSETKKLHFRRAFLWDDEGSATVEVVIWLPFLVALFTLVVDASAMFHNHSSATRIVQDASRALSVGRYETETETQTALLSRLEYLSDQATVETSVTNGVIDIKVEIPASDLDIIGVFEGMADFSFTIRAQHLQEV